MSLAGNNLGRDERQQAGYSHDSTYVMFGMVGEPGEPEETLSVFKDKRPADITCAVTVRLGSLSGQLMDGQLGAEQVDASGKRGGKEERSACKTRPLALYAVPRKAQNCHRIHPHLSYETKRYRRQSGRDKQYSALIGPTRVYHAKC